MPTHTSQIANVEIRVEPDVGPLNAFLRQQMPDAQISAQAMNASIILTGNARSPSEADRAFQMAQTFLGVAGGAGAGTGGVPGGFQTPGNPAVGGNQPRVINMIQVIGSEQVMVRVRVVEMSRTLIRQLGINLNYEQMINQLLNSDDFIKLATTQGFSVNGSILGGLAASGGVAHNILQPSGLTYPGPFVNGATPR